MSFVGDLCILGAEGNFYLLEQLGPLSLSDYQKQKGLIYPYIRLVFF